MLGVTAAVLVGVGTVLATSTTSDCAAGGAVADAANNPGLVSDCEALLASRDALAGSATLNWSADVPITQWDGVTVDGTPLRVTVLSLLGWGLTGEIPEELGTLSNLQSLVLSGNQLTGEIPEELGDLVNLRVLSLIGNRLTGVFPQELTGLTALTLFAFYDNPGLCAPIDEAFQRWLQGIDSLLGSSCAPSDSAEDRSVLLELYGATDGENWADNTNWLSDRPIREWHGVFNDANGRVTGLVRTRDGLVGEVPAELGNLSNLQWLLLGWNQLTGEIPSDLGNLSNLKWLWLSDNQLTGELPLSLTALTMLRRFHFNNNAGLCAPVDETFQTWLQGIATVSGSNCTLEDSPGDRSVLVELYNSMHGSNWTDNTNWLSDEPISEWYGVTIDDEGRVNGLFLADNQLTGEIPAELAKLSNLTILSLASNQLTGEIPVELAKLSNLSQLSLSSNQLTGEIPTELGNLSNLESLYLSGNPLTGCIPAGLRDVARHDLDQLGLPFCDLSQEACSTRGAVSDAANNPGLVSDCAALLAARDTLAGSAALDWSADTPIEEWEGVTLGGTPERVTGLRLINRHLTGTIPPELGSLSKLEALQLHENQLSGQIPAELGSLANLLFLWLSSNQLDGGIPAWLGSLSNLEALQLAGNELSGEIPVELGNLDNLSDLYLSGNQLTGCVPDGLRDLARHDLDQLGLPFCDLSQEACSTRGAVSDAANNPGLVSDCEALLVSRDTLAVSTTLNWSAGTPITQWDGIRVSGTPRRVTRLSLPAKGLGGTVPAELGSLSMLTDLNLRTNQLSGPIPAELGNLINLVRLNLHTNKLSGPIPDLSRLTDIEEMYLPRNMLTGPVPAWLNGMTKMRELWLWGNELSGTIPDLSGMTSLDKLKLAGNNLEGGVPGASALPPSLRWLIIQQNPLGGTIPDLSGMTRLTALWLHTNGLMGEIPASHFPPNVTSVNLHSNQLSGTIPDLSGLERLQWLRLQHNQLSGAIPSTLGDMPSLTRLWLHGNMLEGPIPAALGRLTKLQRLWLSDNNLTDAIPTGLGELSNLVQWRLSGNSLTGCIPAGLAAVEDSDLDQIGLEVCAGP